MDQATQAILGGAVAQACMPRALGGRAWVVGMAAGLAPDLDMAFAPLADPLFPLEVHRTVSHALVVTPLGALVVTLPFLLLPTFRARWPWVYAAAFVGWVTHAPLDCATSYGTMWLWPFSNAWLAWDMVSIVDPVFTITLLVGLVLAARRHRARPAWIALALACCYLGLGAIQQHRVLDAQAQLAAARRETITRGRAIPATGSILAWRSLYRTDDEAIRTDTIAVLPFVPVAVHEGARVDAFGPGDLPTDVADPQVLDEAFAKFHAFADGFTARTPGLEAVVGDMRISVDHGFDPIWGMRIEAGRAPAWVERISGRTSELGRYVRTQLGLGVPFRPLSEVIASEVE